MKLSLYENVEIIVDIEKVEMSLLNESEDSGEMAEGYTSDIESDHEEKAEHRMIVLKGKFLQMTEVPIVGSDSDSYQESKEHVEEKHKFYIMEDDDVTKNIKPYEDETVKFSSDAESENATQVQLEEPGFGESGLNGGESFEGMDNVEFEDEKEETVNEEECILLLTTSKNQAVLVIIILR